MGQAKQRGDREQRVRQAQDKAEKDQAKKKEQIKVLCRVAEYLEHTKVRGSPP